MFIFASATVFWFSSDFILIENKLIKTVLIWRLTNWNEWSCEGFFFLSLNLHHFTEIEALNVSVRRATLRSASEFLQWRCTELWKAKWAKNPGTVSVLYYYGGKKRFIQVSLIHSALSKRRNHLLLLKTNSSTTQVI